MGFDVSCIIDIHTYPREYFCPVCHTLVYPDEAFKSQCSHLFCKSCLAYIVNGSKACPYDGCLVTQSDSKPLIDSDKVLAENISKVRVRCLYFISGCRWKGTLAECTCHWAGCSFGNSFVICTGCGIYVLHRQAHDHTWNCPAMLGAQESVGVVSGSTQLGTTSSTATVSVSQAAIQSGASLSGVQNPAASLVPAQNYNLPLIANSGAPVISPVTLLDPYQWHQQQYLQYYQPYMGCGPYQQPYQHYYHVHQQPFQQYLQYLVQKYGQQQSYVYSHAAPPPQPQMQPPLQLHPQSQHPQAQTQSQPQPLPISEAPQQPSLESQSKGNVQPPKQQQLLPRQLQPIQPCLQPLAEGQIQPQVQQTLLPQLQPQVQAPPHMQAQGSVPAQAFPPNYQANPQQHPHPPHVLPQFHIIPPALPPPSAQQPTVQIYHRQASQADAQSQPLSKTTQYHIQSSNQPHVVESRLQPYVTSSQVPLIPLQANQSTNPLNFPQVPRPPVPPVGGHQQSLGMYPLPSHPASVPLHPIQERGQFQEQHALMQRSQPQVTLPLQQPLTLLPPNNQVPSVLLVQHQQFPAHGQPNNLYPVVQPAEQAVHQQYVWRPMIPQQPLQTHLCPSVPPQWWQSQNYVWRTMIPSQETHPQSHPFSSDAVPLAQSGSSQYPSAPLPVDRSYAEPVSDQKRIFEGTTGSLRELIEKCFGKGVLKEEEATGHNETAVKEADNSTKKPSGGKSIEIVAEVDEFTKEAGHSLASSVAEQGLVHLLHFGSHQTRLEVPVQGQQSLNPAEGKAPSMQGDMDPSDSRKRKSVEQEDFGS